MKMPGQAATRRDTAAWADRLVAAASQGATLPSSPLLALHPRALASRQSPLWGLNPNLSPLRRHPL